MSGKALGGRGNETIGDLVREGSVRIVFGSEAGIGKWVKDQLDKGNLAKEAEDAIEVVKEGHEDLIDWLIEQIEEYNKTIEKLKKQQGGTGSEKKEDN